MASNYSDADQDTAPDDGLETPNPVNAPSGSPLDALPFDPLRLAHALLRRWYWPIIPALLLAPLGGGFGMMMLKTAYTAEIQLIRRPTESGFQATQFGQAFKPGELKIETLTQLMQSVRLLTKVAEIADPPLTHKDLAGAVVITPERRTELVRVALSSKHSAEQAAQLANYYGHEIVALTKELQSSEAKEAEAFLSTELANIDRQLTKVNQEILQFSREETFIDGDKEVEAYLRELGMLEINLQEARISQQSTDLRVQSLRDALRKHNPIATELKAAQEQLSSLLVQYTDKNPLVIEQRDHITNLEQKLETFSSPDTEDSDFTGAQLSDAIYLDLVKLRSESEATAKRINTLETMRTDVKAKLEALPGKSLNNARLQARKSTLAEMRQLIAARHKEAAVYKENALGYYRLFAEISPDNVLISGRGTKVMILAAGAGGMGFALGLFLVLGLELADRRIKTAHDLGRVTQLPILGRLKTFDAGDTAGWERWAFQQSGQLTNALGLAPNATHVIGFLSATDGDGKSSIIHALAQSAAQRNRSVVTLGDTAPSNDAIPVLNLEEALEQPNRIQERLATPGAAGLRWVHLIMPREFTWTLEQRSRWETFLALLRKLPNCTTLIEVMPNYTTDTIL